MNFDKMLCTLGKFDIPIIQMQPPFIVDLLDSNIILFGAAMSGKSTFIKTLVNIIHKQYNEKQEQIFILDFGGALAEYKEFPLVSAYFDNSNEEYVKRVFRIMDNILKNNIKDLSGKNYRDAKTQPIHTTFIIDNLNAFIEESRYLAYQEKLAKLCRDGLSRGITIIVTAVETKGIGSYLGNFKQKIAFEMPQDKYTEIFIGKVGVIGNNPGHGFANVTVKPEGVTGTFKMNLPYEVQCLLPYKLGNQKNNADTQEEFARKLKQKFDFAEGKYAKCVKKYQTFPKELTITDYEKIKQPFKEEPEGLKCPVSVGLDYVDFCPVMVDVEQSHVIAIYGKRQFGKTNLLNVLLDGIASQKQDLRIVFFDDGRNQLKDIYDRFKENRDCLYLNGFSEESLKLKAVHLKAEEIKTKRISSIQHFYLDLNENYIDLSDRIGKIFGISELEAKQRIDNKINNSNLPFTVFVIQSKVVYLNTKENKYFIENVLSRLVSVAEDKGYVFIFSDVPKISDLNINEIFNNNISTAFLLDNIAEFAGERGQRTVFGNMDVKSLKEDYALCEKGDGYFYDIEADKLLKAKFIKYEKE